jgi:hypothetical protein
VQKKGLFWLYVGTIIALRAVDIYHSVHSSRGHFWIYLAALCLRAFTHNIMLYSLFVTVDTLVNRHRLTNLLILGGLLIMLFEAWALFSRRMNPAAFCSQYHVFSLTATDAHGRAHTIISTFDAYNVLTMLVIALTMQLTISLAFSTHCATVVTDAIPLSFLHPPDNGAAGAYNVAGSLLGERIGNAVAAIQRRSLRKILALALAGTAANQVLELSTGVSVRTLGLALVAASLFVAQAVTLLCLRRTALRFIVRAPLARLWWSHVLVITVAEVSIFSQRAKLTSGAFTAAYISQTLVVSGSLAGLPLLDAGTPDSARPLKVGGFLIAAIYLFCNFVHQRLVIADIHSEFTVLEWALPAYGTLSIYNIYSVATMALATLSAAMCYYSIAHPDTALMVHENVPFATLHERMHAEPAPLMSGGASWDIRRRRVSATHWRAVTDSDPQALY